MPLYMPYTGGIPQHAVRAPLARRSQCWTHFHSSVHLLSAVEILNGHEGPFETFLKLWVYLPLHSSSATSHANRASVHEMGHGTRLQRSTHARQPIRLRVCAEHFLGKVRLHLQGSRHVKRVHALRCCVP